MTEFEKRLIRGLERIDNTLVVGTVILGLIFAAVAIVAARI